MKKYRLISILSVFLLIYAVNIISDDYMGLSVELSAQDLPSIEPPPDDRYLGNSWGQGYSWGSQPVLGRTTISVTTSLKFDFDGSGGVTTSGSISNGYTWIGCCNPSNSLSLCNFQGNNTNCIRY